VLIEILRHVESGMGTMDGVGWISEIPSCYYNDTMTFYKNLLNSITVIQILPSANCENDHHRRTEIQSRRYDYRVLDAGIGTHPTNTKYYAQKLRIMSTTILRICQE
jgi:tRNA U38,U39,U40 pseudouridine synthase TruA